MTAQLIATIASGLAPTVLVLVGIMVNNGRFNTIDGRLLAIEKTLGDLRERVTRLEERQHA